MNYDNDPTIIERDGVYYHRPGHVLFKLVYLVVGIAILAFGLQFLWEPGGRLLLGNEATARVVRIVKVIPGANDQIYRYRRDYEDERDRSIIFQHYVSVLHEGSELDMRLGVDARVKPYVNVNDRLDVVFYDKDTYAYPTWAARSWGMGLLYTVIGLIFVATAIPMLWAARKLIPIDPEAEDEDSAAKPEHEADEQATSTESDGKSPPPSKT